MSEALFENFHASFGFPSTSPSALRPGQETGGGGGGTGVAYIHESGYLEVGDGATSRVPGSRGLLVVKATRTGPEARASSRRSAGTPY